MRAARFAWRRCCRRTGTASTCAGVSAGAVRYDVTLERSPGRLLIRFVRREPGPGRVDAQTAGVAPALPLDARVQRVTVNGTRREARGGDRWRRAARADPHRRSLVVHRCRVHVTTKVRTCTSSRRICSRARRAMDCGFCASRAEHHGAPPDVEGRGGRTYVRRRADAAPARDRRRRRRLDAGGRDPQLRIRFDGPAGQVHSTGNRRAAPRATVRHR